MYRNQHCHIVINFAQQIVFYSQNMSKYGQKKVFPLTLQTLIFSAYLTNVPYFFKNVIISRNKCPFFIDLSKLRRMQVNTVTEET